eukprot:TRINITY_DN3019_c0_g1_i1.p1 TRINITY_DN3019_c0_g1~~TRINITY_DN3019_c0_g1_i1.p1  ORF type:complete len:577 (-),score=203.12 TRINITY_DN3019_c0_g1_i1:252-1982(-)
MSKAPKPRQKRMVMDDAGEEEDSAGRDDSEHSTEDVTDLTCMTETEGGALDYDQDEEEDIMNAIPSGKMEKMRDKRNNIATEILTTERTYVKNLDIIVQTYMEPLNKAVDEGVFTRDEYKSIFGNCRIIRGYNQLLLADLEARLTDWSDTQLIGDVFLRMVVFLKTYTQYINDFDTSRATLKRMLEENGRFRDLLNQLDSSPVTGRQILKDFLIMPVQRIPRYTMLLRDLWAATWPAHPDYSNLMTAYSKMEEITQFVEDGKEKTHNISKVADIQSKLMGKKSENLHLVKPGRILLMEGPLVEIIKGDQLKTRYVCIFTDFILITKPRKGGKLEIRHAAPLYKMSSIKQSTLLDERRGLEFELGSVPIQMLPETPQDDIEPWFKRLLGAYMDAVEVRQKFLKASQEEGMVVSEEGTPADRRRAKTLRGTRKIKRASMKVATMPQQSSEGTVHTSNPLYRLAAEGANPPKRSTITYGDVVQSEMRAATRRSAHQKTKGGRLKRVPGEDDSAAASVPDSGSMSDEDEVPATKKRGLTFAEEGSGSSSGSSRRGSFMRSMSVENIKHQLLSSKKVSKDV